MVRGAPALIAMAVCAACAGGSGDDSDAVSQSVPAPVSTIAQPTTEAPPDTEPPPTSTAPTSTESDATEPTAGDATTSTTSTTTTTTTTTVPPDPPPPNDALTSLRLGVDLVVDVAHPTAVVWRPVDGVMYVATQDGEIYRLDDAGAPVVVADLTGETVEFAPGSERGLLGLDFDPRDGRMFVDYTDLDNNTHVVSFEMDGDAPDLSTRREVLFLEQPGLGHNGGRLLFDPDGNLFISSGDGGGSNGRDAQDTTRLFGAILRITPNLDGDGYDIPPDNPFADGVDDRPEIWARGFRNPWTFSIDDETGNMWIGDVGNDTREEIDIIPAGAEGGNYGWPFFEGTHQRRSEFPEGLVPPVFDYDRSQGVAAMGGHVYRGEAIPALRGAYLFGDLGGPIWAIGADGVSRLDAEKVSGLVGWAEDPDGELYLLGLTDGVYRLVER